MLRLVPLCAPCCSHVWFRLGFKVGTILSRISTCSFVPGSLLQCHNLLAAPAIAKFTCQRSPYLLDFV